MSVGEENIPPAVVVEIEESGAETDILAVYSEPSLQTRVLKRSVAIVAIECRDLVREVGAHDVERAVAIIVAYADSHSRERHPVFIECTPGRNGDLAERAVMVVAVELARCRVAGYVDVRPTVVVEIGRRC